MSNRQPKDDLNDSDLLRLSGNGDEDAFLALYRRHQSPVFRFALHMSGRREIAEEVTQEVFMTLLSEPKFYAAGRGPLEGYLIGIARNKVRRQLTHSRVCMADLDAAKAGISLPEELNKQEELAALQSAILTLPPNYREVIVLCDLENMDYAQSAASLVVPSGRCAPGCTAPAPF